MCESFEVRTENSLKSNVERCMWQRTICLDFDLVPCFTRFCSKQLQPLQLRVSTSLTVGTCSDAFSLSIADSIAVSKFKHFGLWALNETLHRGMPLQKESPRKANNSTMPIYALYIMQRYNRLMFQNFSHSKAILTRHIGNKKFANTGLVRLAVSQANSGLHCLVLQPAKRWTGIVTMFTNIHFSDSPPNFQRKPFRSFPPFLSFQKFNSQNCQSLLHIFYMIFTFCCDCELP